MSVLRLTADLNATLRLRLHDGKLIKDRRYHFRTYPNCFVAHELIDWLVSHKEAADRATAASLMQHLMDHDILHHGKKEAPASASAKEALPSLAEINSSSLPEAKSSCCFHGLYLKLPFSQSVTRGQNSRMPNCCTVSARMMAHFPLTQR